MCDWAWETRCRCPRCEKGFYRRVLRIGADEWGTGGVLREDGPRMQVNGLRCPECGGGLWETANKSMMLDPGLMLTWKEVWDGEG